MDVFAFDRRAAPLGDGYIKAMQLPERLPFVKMEGLGNDYVYVWVDDPDWPLTDPGPLAVRISDRNFGVGGDGLVLIGKSKVTDFRMRMLNADGSEGEMCGNAARCVGKYVYDRGLTGKTGFGLETLGGIRTLQVNLKNGTVDTVCVDMGKPRLHPAALPMNAEGENFINREIMVGGESYHGTAVSMGNPHLVVPVPDIDKLDLPALGPEFERHRLFPHRVNTEFIEVLSCGHVRMRVWERGSGETLACGTGACAVLAACVLNGWTGRSAVIVLRGGELLIEWAGDGNIRMTGPAREVFSGVFNVRD